MHLNWAASGGASIASGGTAPALEIHSHVHADLARDIAPPLLRARVALGLATSHLQLIPLSKSTRKIYYMQLLRQVAIDDL